MPLNTVARVQHQQKQQCGILPQPCQDSFSSRVVSIITSLATSCASGITVPRQLPLGSTQHAERMLTAAATHDLAQARAYCEVVTVEQLHLQQCCLGSRLAKSGQ